MSVYPPLASRKVTSGYRTKARPDHDGTDYRAATGTPVFASIDGVVKTGTGHPAAGTWIEIHDADGTVVGYSHLSARAVKHGQRVKAGDRIGATGATGRATAPHLHFYVRTKYGYTDPVQWLKRNVGASKPAKAKTTSDYLTRREIKRLQEGLRRVFPAYRSLVDVRRGDLIDTDGIDGPQTRAWVGEFQKRTGLKPDKIAGPRTIAMAARYGIDIKGK